jgi:flagellar biosynthetic protein FliR
MELLLDPSSLAGMVLSVTRVGAFAVASPLFKPFPVAGRTAFALAIGWALSGPAFTDPTLSGFVMAVAANAGVGIVLGFITGIMIHAFSVAGSMIDFTSGLNASQLFDPISGQNVAVFSRAFNLMAITLWFVLGGAHLAVEGLGATIVTIPLDGTISFSTGLADTAVTLVGQMLLSALQLTIPTFAALMVAEVALGVASRFSPQANVFALGLPVKIIATLSTVSLVVAGFPAAVSGSIASSRDTIITVIRGLGG